MRILFVAPQLGFSSKGDVKPGGLQVLGRCVVRTLSSDPRIRHLSVWTQADPASAEIFVNKMIAPHRHTDLVTEVKCFNYSRMRLGAAILAASLYRKFDHVMYLLINQSTLSLFPFHPNYSIWEIGEELFQPIPFIKQRALRNAKFLISISKNTDDMARRFTHGLPAAHIVHLCVEPPMYSRPQDDPAIRIPYDPGKRKPVVFILARMNHRHLYKGHQELIKAWPQVLKEVPDAELWIGGEGDGSTDLRALRSSLPQYVAEQVKFLGRLTPDEVDRCFQVIRVFAMPSRKEGFGLVFVEAARYGLPSIGGNEDSVKEVVIENQTGLLVDQNVNDVANACIRLLCDDVFARKLGEAARQRYLEYFQFHNFQQRLLDKLGVAIFS